MNKTRKSRQKKEEKKKNCHFLKINAEIDERVMENKILFIDNDSTFEIKGVPYKAILMPWAEQKDLKT
jgi:hypothetical protein